MTFRALFLGLVAAVVIVCSSVVNKTLWHLPLDYGTHLPLAVYGFLLVGILCVNPVLYTIRSTWRLGSRELAVILATAMSGCHLAGTGLMTQVPQLLSMPLQINQTTPAWRRYKLLSYVPPVMLVNNATYDPARESRIIDGMLNGLGRVDHPVSLWEVPWKPWVTPLSYWLSIIALMGIASICLALIVHRQWAIHERLRYPIAEFASSLIRQDPDRSLGPVYHDKMFWWGFLVLLTINMVNYLNAWFPHFPVTIPFRLDFTPLVGRWPSLGNAFVDYFLPTPTIIPTAMAFAYFLSFDTGFSLRFSCLAHGFTKLGLMAVGVSVSTNYILGGWDAYTRFGGFVGLAAILLYTGRRYYAQVVRAALGLGRGAEADPSAGWALRIAVAASSIVVVMLTIQGLDWPLAVMAVMTVLVLFVVVSRISAETGLFAMEARWMPVGVVIGLMGRDVLGLKNLFILGIMSMVLCASTSESLMPHVVNAMKIAQTVGVKARSLSRSVVGGLLLAMLAGIVVGLWAYYNYGLPRDDWVNNNLPRRAFQAPEQSAVSLTLAGQMETVESYRPLERFSHIKPTPRFVAWTLIGLAAVLLVSAARLRFSWWPLHPVFVVVWGSWTMGVYAFSILVGWAIKGLVTHFGGAILYRRLQPFMIGLIAGDVLSSVIKLIVGAVSYVVTGLRGAS
jgi:hypothetical protein